MKMFLPLSRLIRKAKGDFKIEELTLANNNVKEVANKNKADNVLEDQDSGFCQCPIGKVLRVIVQ